MDTPQKEVVRGHINTVILASLYEGDKYGYEIGKEIENKTSGKYKLKEPTLYSSLKRLEKQGLIESYFGDDGETKGGRRRYYKLTEQGLELTSQNMSRWEFSRTLLDKLVSDKEYDLENDPPVFDDSDLHAETLIKPVKVPEAWDKAESVSPPGEAAAVIEQGIASAQRTNESGASQAKDFGGDTDGLQRTGGQSGGVNGLQPAREQSGDTDGLQRSSGQSGSSHTEQHRTNESGGVNGFKKADDAPTSSNLQSTQQDASAALPVQPISNQHPQQFNEPEPPIRQGEASAPPSVAGYKQPLPPAAQSSNAAHIADKSKPEERKNIGTNDRFFREEKLSEAEIEYKSKLMKLFGAAKSASPAAAPAPLPQQEPPRSAPLPVRPAAVLPHERDTARYDSKFSAVKESLEAEGIKVKVYKPEAEGSYKQHVSINKLLLVMLALLYLTMIAELAGVYLLLENQILLGDSTYLYIALGLLVFPLYGLLRYAAAPSAKAKAKINARALMLDSLLLFTYIFLSIIAVNLVIKVSFANTGDVLRRVFLPALLTFNIIVGSVLYCLLYKAKKFQV